MGTSRLDRHRSARRVAARRCRDDDELCASWSTTGIVERVGTWHDADYGVSLASQGAGLSQKVTRYDEAFSCVNVSVLGEWDSGSTMTSVYVDEDQADASVDASVDADHWYTPQVERSGFVCE